MSEDLKLETEVKTEEVKQEEVSPTIQKAMDQGWKPKEEWVSEGKDPHDWRDAKEYVERGELFDLIDSQKKELKQVRKALDKLKDHHLKVRETAYDEAVRHLKAQLAEAKKEEDLGAVIDLNDRINELKDKKAQELDASKQELEVSTSPDEEMQSKFQNWQKRNSWYKPDTADKITAYAEKVGVLYRKEHPDVSFDDFLNHIEKEVKREFSDAFKPPKKGSNVEGSGETRPGGKESSYPLTEEEQKIMTTLVKSNVITKEKYIEELKAYDKSKGITR